jgi:hypothetical protein
MGQLSSASRLLGEGKWDGEELSCRPATQLGVGSDYLMVGSLLLLFVVVVVTVTVAQGSFWCNPMHAINQAGLL